MATIDKSLDDIISSRPKSGGRRGTRRGPSRPSGPRPSTEARARYSGTVPAANGNRVASATLATPLVLPQNDVKIMVSSLPLDVNEQQIKELFTSTVGPLREVNLHHDAHGKSKGIAYVVFAKRGDANRAYGQYNGRLIDGKKPMKIEIIFDPTRAAPPPSLSQRVAPAPVATPAVANGRNGGKSAQSSNRNAGGKVANTRGKGGRGARVKTPRTEKTAADLDAEMEDYTTQTAPAATATTA